MRLKTLIIAMAMAILAVNCSKPEEDNVAKTMSIDPISISFEAAGGTQTFAITTNADKWTATKVSGTEWVTLSSVEGKGTAQVTITAQPNTSARRTSIWSIAAEGVASKSTLTIIQESGSSNAGTTVVANPATWDGVKRASISYQALVYSFADGNSDKIGDFKGFEDHLDYIDKLGATAVWLSPVHPAASYHGYDVKDYSAINSEYGTEADFKALIDMAHSKGIKVYMDYVLNHTSKEHPWFLSAKDSKDSPYRDFYILTQTPAEDIAAGKIAMIATEGSNGYDAGQWFPTGGGTTGRFRFDLDWSVTPPTVKVTSTTEAAEVDNPDASATDAKYIYYGVVGENHKCYPDGNGKFHLIKDFDSPWGFLVRTSATSWAAGTKFGASSNSDIVTLGKAFSLTSTGNAFDIRFEIPYFYHSHMWTDWFTDLNYGPVATAENSGAFKAVTESADKWIKMGVDGFRLDAVKHIYHNGYNDENPKFLKKFYDRCNQSYKANGGTGEFYMVGEMFDDAAKVAPYYAGLPAFFEFSFWYKLKWGLENGVGSYFADDILSFQGDYANYRKDYIEATKLSNHDENRAATDLGKSVEKEKLAAAVLLTAQGSPYIFQGEELGYWGDKSKGDEYVRTPIMWTKDGNNLASAKLDGKIDNSMLTQAISVEAQEANQNSILNVYRTFAKLRNTYPALANGKMSRHSVYNNSMSSPVAVWYMQDGSQKMLVVHNFSATSQSLSFTDNLSKPVGLLGNAIVGGEGGSGALKIGAYSSVVFEL